MKQSIEKFLEFNGKTLVFISIEGIYYVAIRPVCEAINVEYTRVFKNIKRDPILGPALAIQPMQVPGDQVRNMTCLPEHFIYGWLFSIKSESKELFEFKKECYLVLYEYFHGTITRRKKLFGEKASNQSIINKLESKFRIDPEYVKMEELKARNARIGKELKEMDTSEYHEQLDMFSDSPPISDN